MKNKITAIISVSIAALLFAFTIGFSCFAPQKQDDSTIDKVQSFWQELFGRPDYYDWNDYDYGSSYEYTPEIIAPDWVEIYSQTYISFIEVDENMMSGLDIIVIDTSVLEYISDAQREEIVKNIEQTGYEIIDATFEELDATDFFLMEKRNANSPEYLNLILRVSTYTDYDISLYGGSYHYFDDTDGVSSGINYIQSYWTLVGGKWLQTDTDFQTSVSP